MSSWIHPRGTLGRGAWDVVVDEAIDGWQHTGLRVGSLRPGEELVVDGAGVESILLPLEGSFSVSWTDAAGAPGTQELDGRRSVIDEITDSLYLGVGTRAVLTGEGRIAVTQARTEEVLPAHYLPAADVPVLVRGAGRLSREVRNFGMAGVAPAAKILACEVITPGGNWSSYPAHKHDEHIDGVEEELEEIYYFEVRPSVDGVEDPYALFSTRGSGERELVIDARVGDGDTVLVPFGFHGPLAVPPGAMLYQLNVMAGPGARVWNAVNEAGAAAVIELVEQEGADARLPLARVSV